MRVAVMSANRLLVQGLSDQIHEAGGQVVGLAGDEEVDAILIDGGAGPELLPMVEPESAVPAFLLASPAARARLDSLAAHGFAGYLLKPVRQSALEERLAPLRRAEAEAVMAPEEREPGLELPPLVAPPPQFQIRTLVPEELAPAPAPPVPPESHAPAPQPPGPAHAAAGSQTGLTILLAEDNPINMMLIRELLRRRGHNVVEVTNGNDAVTAMAERTFDLLLTDIHMPGMDGIEAARVIRRDEAEAGRPRVPIVALTADAMETGKRACREAGMDGFLTKPVDPAELEEMFLMLFPSEDGPLIVAA
jgi:CheY-like chemotaxis protein